MNATLHGLFHWRLLIGITLIAGSLTLNIWKAKSIVANSSVTAAENQTRETPPAAITTAPSTPCANEIWAATSLSNAPTARYGHTAVWTGTEMIVWGGQKNSGSDFLNSGARYNPATDSWTAISTTNAPSARSQHTAVWTGTEMIVWGGGNFNNGARYNPATDSWTTISTTNAPSARHQHVAVWTGTEMIVHGGRSNGSLNSGGRYNPATDTWTATSLTNAAQSHAHTAVWTGTEMIVWGGIAASFTGNFVLLKSGGRYNPATNSWTITNSVSAPFGRAFHSAVWTGAEMIIWGGTDIFNFTNTGGRYNPNTDTWTPTSLMNAPKRRQFHSAVWTGTEMLIWGSSIDAGRYHPATDIWTPLTLTNAPELRTQHTTVWTGTEMIVWGGDSFGFDRFDTGGRYCPGAPIPPNRPPTITPIAQVMTPGSSAQNLPIAMVFDSDQAANTLTVGLVGANFTVNGVTISNVRLSAAGQVTANFVAAANATTANFGFRVQDADGAVADATVIITVAKLSGSISDPLVCTGPGSTIKVTLVLGNPNNVPLGVSDTTTFTNLVGVPGSCTVTPNVGTCTVTNANLTYTTTLAANQTVTITYLTQVTDNLSPGAQVCTNNRAQFGENAGTIGPGGITFESSTPPLSLQVCGAVNCPPAGPGALPQAASPLSDQKAGSVLIYNIYTSATDSTRQNTRLSITNTDPARAANVHFFFVDGASCSVADSSLCLTPNQTMSFLAGDLDPGTTGYVVAVATDALGCPVNFNFLIGDEYVKFASGHAANLGAEAIAALAGGQPACDQNASTAQLRFDGLSYNPLPRVLALDNLPSRADGNDTLLILNRIGGNLGLGASTLGTIFGILYNDAEASLSFSLSGGCQLRGSISNSFPRTAPRFENFVPAGRSGWMKFYSQDTDMGILGAAINFNVNAAANAGAFNQGHNLHALTNTSAMSYVIPILPPNC